ncbi:hypothetical protein Krac_3953 [Ktedonobacter racemifer DSM 44963]|uniref:Uncharacterized protein n=1 Tax=Ktedonobacter racemifer DSM 44963 TaxID=485913 RepID=D6U3Q1_KTERA|nr:hypothetical protein Krac_3953 [Ktedonobacter racemifer DSM 44963]
MHSDMNTSTSSGTGPVQSLLTTITQSATASGASSIGQSASNAASNIMGDSSQSATASQSNRVNAFDFSCSNSTSGFDVMCFQNEVRSAALTGSLPIGEPAHLK